MPGDQVKGKDSAIFFSSSSVAQRPQTQAKRRNTVVTDLLNQNVPLEDVQYLAGHSNPRTTQIYDRRRRRVTWNIVERISI